MVNSPQGPWGSCPSFDEVIVGWFRFAPFVGRLPECSGSDLKEAGTEVLVATVFSTMPLWLLPVLSAVLFVHPVSGYEAIRSGELFLFSAALVGPLVYIISKNYGERHDNGSVRVPLLHYSIRFPYGQGFIYACVAICLISSFAFIVLRNPLFSDTNLSRVINYDGVIGLSWATFVSATIIFYCATAYRNGIDNIVRVMPSQEEDFVREWEMRK
jgi:hypothetical protein